MARKAKRVRKGPKPETPSTYYAGGYGTPVPKSIVDRYKKKIGRKVWAGVAKKSSKALGGYAIRWVPGTIIGIARINAMGYFGLGGKGSKGINYAPIYKVRLITGKVIETGSISTKMITTRRTSLPKPQRKKRTSK
jgi:hypothetical protein